MMKREIITIDTISDFFLSKKELMSSMHFFE